jgi:hypothetical protein
MDIYNDKEHKRNGYWRREAAKTKKMAARARQEASRSSTRIDDLEKKIEAMEATMTSMMTKHEKLLARLDDNIDETKIQLAAATEQANHSDYCRRQTDQTQHVQISKLQLECHEIKEAMYLRFSLNNESLIYDFNKMQNMVADTRDEARKATLTLATKIEVLQHRTGLVPAASTITAALHGYLTRLYTLAMSRTLYWERRTRQAELVFSNIRCGDDTIIGPARSYYTQALEWDPDAERARIFPAYYRLHAMLLRTQELQQRRIQKGRVVSKGSHLRLGRASRGV